MKPIASKAQVLGSSKRFSNLSDLDGSVDRIEEKRGMYKACEWELGNKQLCAGLVQSDFFECFAALLEAEFTTFCGSRVAGWGRRLVC